MQQPPVTWSENTLQWFGVLTPGKFRVDEHGRPNFGCWMRNQEQLLCKGNPTLHILMWVKGYGDMAEYLREKLDKPRYAFIEGPLRGARCRQPGDIMEGRGFYYVEIKHCRVFAAAGHGYDGSETAVVDRKELDRLQRIARAVAEGSSTSRFAIPDSKLKKFGDEFSVDQDPNYVSPEPPDGKFGHV